MNTRKKQPRWTFVYSIILLLFTIYFLLDTFVLPRSYQVVDGTTSAPEQLYTPSITDGQSPVTTARFTATPVLSEKSYSDQNISILITEHRQYDSTIYVADVLLSSPEYLKTAFAENTYGRNIKDQTSDIAQANDALFAVNGDFYGARNDGYVLRNGVLYRKDAATDQEDLVIWKDGTFKIIKEAEITATQLWETGANQVFSFGPALIIDEAIMVSEKDYSGISTDNPRTAIGIVDNLHYFFVVSDGRTEQSKGLSFYELAQFTKSLGVKTAYNLDGGGSSAMYFNGNTINTPTADGDTIRERRVSDIVYIRP